MYKKKSKFKASFNNGDRIFRIANWITFLHLKENRTSSFFMICQMLGVLTLVSGEIIWVMKTISMSKKISMLMTIMYYHI